LIRGERADSSVDLPVKDHRTAEVEAVRELVGEPSAVGARERATLQERRLAFLDLVRREAVLYDLAHLIEESRTLFPRSPDWRSRARATVPPDRASRRSPPSVPRS